MTNCNKINKDRLRSWSKKLTDEHATALLVLGVCHDHKLGQLTLIATEDRSTEDVLAFLSKAVEMIEGSMAKKT